jgi:hypothetical protein
MVNVPQIVELTENVSHESAATVTGFPSSATYAICTDALVVENTGSLSVQVKTWAPAVLAMEPVSWNSLWKTVGLPDAVGARVGLAIELPDAVAEPRATKLE